MADWLQQRKLASQKIEANELGLEDARRQDDDEVERRRMIRDATMEPVRDADSGKVVSYQPRELSDDEKMDLYERLGAHALRSGKLTPDKALVFKQQIKDAEEEGMFDAYNTYRQTGNIEDATRMFNRRGKTRVQPDTIMESERIDPLTRQPYKAYVARAENGDIMTFDPLAAARMTGGRKGWLESQKSTIEGRKADAAEKRNQLYEESIMSRERVGMAGVEQRRDAADDRADGVGGRSSVFQQKQSAWLSVHPGDTAGALDYAGGRRVLSPAEARLAAEKMATSMRDSNTNQPLSTSARRAAANQIFSNIMAEQGAHSAPPTAAAPGTPRSQSRPSLNNFFR